MGSGLVLLGLSFFIIPSFGMIDFMPDFIGCALIMKGLSKLSTQNGDAERARDRFKFLLIITLLRFVMIIPLAMISDEMTTMLFVFSFAVAETVFLILAAFPLIEGVNHVSSRYGCEIPERRYNDMKIVFPLFAAARAVLVAAPELTVLTNPVYRDVIDVTELDKPTLYSAKNLVFAVCLGISLFIGVVFYISACGFFSAPMKDKAANEKFIADYNADIAANPVRTVCKNVKTAALLIVSGTAFLCTLHFYGLDVLFDLIGFALICAGFAVLRNYSPYAKKALLVSAAAAAVSVASAVLSVYISTVHYHKTYVMTVGAVRAYTALAIVLTVEYALYAAIMFYLYKVLCDAVRDYVRAPVFDEAEYKKEFSLKYVVLCSVGAGLCPVMSAFGFLYMYEEEVWIVGLLLFAAFSVYMLKTLLTLPAEIERRL
ncbi:MAG: hypothetical protein II777_07945 [Clostridia bacterium]|nr:hypothetical protein [Clostridia bacterium]